MSYLHHLALDKIMKFNLQVRVAPIATHSTMMCHSYNPAVVYAPQTPGPVVFYTQQQAVGYYPNFQPIKPPDYSVAVASGPRNIPAYQDNAGIGSAGPSAGQSTIQSAHPEGGPSGSNLGPSGSANTQPSDFQMYGFDSKPPPYAP